MFSRVAQETIDRTAIRQRPFRPLREIFCHMIACSRRPGSPLRTTFTRLRTDSRLYRVGGILAFAKVLFPLLHHVDHCRHFRGPWGEA